METRITVLIDNAVTSPGLKCQHGLSLWVEAGSTRILFDTGQDGLFLQNAARLGVAVAGTEWLVLSHGHYDHTGGVPALLQTGARPCVVAHPGLWTRRRSVRAGAPPRDAGAPWPRQTLDDYGVRWVDGTRPVRIAPGVWTTGGIARTAPSPPSNGLEAESREGWSPDAFPDEQALAIRTVDGLVVVTGCCHAGLENTVAAARRVSGEDRLLAVAGGLHLLRTEPSEARRLAALLRGQGARFLFAGHCTGEEAHAAMREVMGASCGWAGSGSVLRLPGPTSGC